MDLRVIERHPQRVLEALRRGAFDALEIIGEADERDFFERRFREKLSVRLAATMPGKPKKEEVPRGFVLAAQMTLKPHQENSCLAFERVIRCGGLLSALPPDLAGKHIDPKTQSCVMWFDEHNHVALFREAYRDGSEESWALLTTGTLGDGWGLRQDYARRTDIEERHRQLKCFYDLTGFRRLHRGLPRPVRRSGSTRGQRQGVERRVATKGRAHPMGAGARGAKISLLTLFVATKARWS